jgi:hypothetical protein
MLTASIKVDDQRAEIWRKNARGKVVSLILDKRMPWSPGLPGGKP